MLTSSTSIGISIATAGQIRPERAALTGEVTAGNNDNATVITRSTNFTWTGNHTHNGSFFTVDVTGAVTLAGDAASSFSTSVGTLTLSAATDLVLQAGGGTLTLSLDGTSGMRLASPQNVVLRHDGGDEVMIESDDATGGYLHIEESASPPVVGTGVGSIRVSTAHLPMFTDQTEDEYHMTERSPAGLLTFDYTFDTSTTMADPGTADVRFNNSDPASVTQIVIDDVDDNGVSVGLGGFQSPFSWGQLIRAFITVRAKSNPSKYVTFRSTTANDQSGYWDATVVYVTSSGDSFTNGEEITVSISPIVISTTFPAPVALEADMEAATNLALVVPPGRMHRHPGVAKAWARGTQSSTTILSSYNVASQVDVTGGRMSWAIATDFSNNNACVTSSASANNMYTSVSNVLTTTVQVDVYNDTGGLNDPNNSIHFHAFGDQ